MHKKFLKTWTPLIHYAYPSRSPAIYTLILIVVSQTSSCSPLPFSILSHFPHSSFSPQPPSLGSLGQYACWLFSIQRTQLLHSIHNLCLAAQLMTHDSPYPRPFFFLVVCTVKLICNLHYSFSLMTHGCTVELLHLLVTSHICTGLYLHPTKRK